MILSDIATLVHGTLSGDGLIGIERVAKIEDAIPGDITFLANQKYRKHLLTTRASAVLIARDENFKELAESTNAIALVRVPDPYLAFLKLIEIFHPPAERLPEGVHSSAVVSPSAKLGGNIAVGAHVVIGQRCVIGEGSTIHPGVVVGDDVTIGTDALLYSNVSIRECCKLGDRVTIHPGAVIGSDGFGFAPKPDGTYEKIPQRGIVVIESDVEIGSNTTIDRATLGETRIKQGAKLDNLVQIGHNVVIGRHTVIAGQSGISGSTKIGDYCVIAGQVGFAGHLEIADHTTFGAKTGVPKSIKESGKIYFGYPARELRTTLKLEAALNQLPQLLVDVREMGSRLETLGEKLNELSKNSSNH